MADAPQHFGSTRGSDRGLRRASGCTTLCLVRSPRRSLSGSGVALTASVCALLGCGESVGARDSGREASTAAEASARDVLVTPDATVDDAEALLDAPLELGYRDLVMLHDFAPPEPCPPDSGNVELMASCDFYRSAETCPPNLACLEVRRWMGDGLCGHFQVERFCGIPGTLEVGERCDVRRSAQCVPGAVCYAIFADARCYHACSVDPAAPSPCPAGTLCEPSAWPDLGLCL